MTAKLTDEMRTALQASPERPLPIEDEQTQKRYVIVPWALFERLAALFGDDEIDVTDAYAAQSAAAAAAGWDDPEMDVYDNYDANKGAS